MKIYIIKHKGANTFQNLTLDFKVEFSNNEIIYAGRYFWRKKDAKTYLKTYAYPEFYEVVGCELEQTKQDNRKIS